MGWGVFFFQQKAAYGVLRSLVGSEMGIRGRSGLGPVILGRVVCCRDGIMGIVVRFLKSSAFIAVLIKCSRCTLEI